MVAIKWFHPKNKESVVGFRSGSKSAELSIHLSEGDIKRLMNFGKKGQLKPSRYGESFRWSGPLRIISTGKKKPRPSTKPKPAPPIPRVGILMARDPRKIKPKKRRKSTGKLSAYNLFVQKHRLAGKDMKQIGVMWRKKKR